MKLKGKLKYELTDRMGVVYIGGFPNEPIETINGFVKYEDYLMAELGRWIRDYPERCAQIKMDKQKVRVMLVAKQYRVIVDKEAI